MGYNIGEFKYLAAEHPVSDSDIIRQEISDDSMKKEIYNVFNGVYYYIGSDNTAIKKRSSDKFITDVNHKVYNNFFKKIVDQKVNFLLGKPVVVNNADNINNVLNINKIIKKVAREACKKGVEWIYPYVDKNGEFKVINIDSRECIPIFDEQYETELIQMIRYYKIDMIENGNKIARYKVEIYDAEKITYYMEDEKGNYFLDTSLTANPLYYMNFNTVLNGEVIDTQYHSWGRVPFIPLWNNDDKINDLMPIKEHIDLYNIIESDWANNLEQIQDALLVIINRAIGNTKNEYEDFIRTLKERKIIEVDENGDASFLTLDLPFDARKEFLTIIRDNIFEFGQAVDTRRVADGNTTNVVIKSRYADLDLKCDDFETQVTSTLEDLFWFINKYLEITNKKQDEIGKVEIVYNRNIIFNKTESIDIFVKQGGRISNETLLETHPDVKDVQKEILRIDKEDMGYNDNNNIDNNNIENNMNDKTKVKVNEEVLKNNEETK